jgi:hypothetical protein
MPQSKWEGIVEEKIGLCNICRVLVGKQTYNAIGVKKEIAMAKEQNVPIYGIYVDGAGTGTHLPDGLPSYKVKSWTWDNVTTILKAAMKEGKNKD